MTKGITYVRPDNITKVHDSMIRACGGLPGEHRGGLDSLCQTVETYHDEPTLEGRAAFYLSRIAKGHYFNDGNKRTAYFVTKLFLMMNGADLDGTDVQQTVYDVVRIASAENKDAYGIAREFIRKYIIADQATIDVIPQFERCVLNNIEIANLLSKQ